ncbi:MAG: hypothetical protein Q9193_003244 [Seirophora villosa]
MSPQSPPGYDQDYPWAPPAPEVPHSPTTTTTFSTQSSTASSSHNHWLPIVFATNRPTTPFRQTGEVSTVYGVNLPGSSARLASDYDKILDLPFEDGDLRVRLYHRNSDQRARIHCRLSRNGRSQRQACLPLTTLRVQRQGSTLKLLRVDSTGHARELWACLRFLCYERLVLFYCAFLALRSEDSASPIGSLVDYELHGEKSIYAGGNGRKIIDDNYQHALRVFKDRDSGGIRLQASALRGELKRKHDVLHSTPVWTAFITTHIHSSRWMRKAASSSNVIRLADLQRFVFSNEYNPPLGQHELRFISSSDADDFMDRIDDLAA